MKPTHKPHKEIEMNLAWMVNGINISSIATVHIAYQTVVKGTGTKDTAQGTRPFEYEASLAPTGWVVTIISMAGRKGTVYGSTFNLALEVATAARDITF